MQLAASQAFLQVIRSSPFNTASAGNELPQSLMPDDFDVSSDENNSQTSSHQDNSLIMSNLVQSQNQRQQVMEHLQFYRGQIIRSSD
jgi:hypothetical protein